MLLTQTTTPEDVKALNRAELPQLCSEIRHAILESSAAVGGHVAPNLGVVELTVALHRVFNSPTDKIVFDVSHQTYAHKALTGRAYTYIDPERYGEASGFANPDESEHDLFAMGHTSTSISLGCGLAHARDLAGDTYNVITVIGDGSLSGGLAFEGFNNAAELDSNLIIIVNDNDQSIAENHGGLYRNLAELRASNGTCERNVFRAMGLDYRYLDAGNDVLALVDALQELRDVDRPIVLHVSTAKGKGFEPAQSDPEHWHHVGPFDMATGRKLCPGHPSEPAPRTYADITGEALSAAIERDPQVVGITAATPYIMGFTPELRAAAGKQFIDVGIAEEHAVTFATALARSGAKPVFGVYGTFLQRAYDELWHDLCLNDMPATILVFGASIFGTTSETHLSFFDISMLGGLPNMRYLAPTCMEEYLSMLSWSLDHREHPAAIRVPGIGLVSRPDLAPAEDTDYSVARYNVVRQGRDVAVLALGDFFELGERVANRLAAEYGIEATLVNPRFATELDREFLDSLAVEHRVVVTLEDGILDGGWGERVACYLACTPLRARTFGIAKGFPDRYDPNELLAQNGMTVENMAAETVKLLNA
ncbi:1-deoxy-D-xylulose-5-phosphate synthase [Collinsella sp. BIOML-A4]|uniref:1-deoxy-D-xylulose-5-phosphate synthase n=1 Tax=Collinsella TaxID=102106 RepID=UPI001260C89E|nr:MULTISPECIES: 1-deoxy-D-xylulose-5-phosphate synthase [Collinsella]MZJ32904.1 1-deoxy-D-xylulose-5-phosphate synthase [Collinsella sp. BIOML-A1]MZJ27052.1 1-deoxy-D-xylulose-5-phosphate synthase [Collinsella sp. BIOML-A2]MZJ29565.1 1-deoxy-D-xylulose-5-phosphate synthase [Collinsella sp. BIOML-A3]MZJ96617.1 1-deoxy-D-xylulose-5-phosphate synthase [Collinsella sp. BIOML-A6]MZK30423.1 1-deoxy-D-xylulose-5-phosphate synthase [Collinsella sp. BIOML-A5]